MDHLEGCHADPMGQGRTLIRRADQIVTGRQLDQEEWSLTPGIEKHMPLRQAYSRMDLRNKGLMSLASGGKFEDQGILTERCRKRLRFLMPDAATDIGDGALRVGWW